MVGQKRKQSQADDPFRGHVGRTRLARSLSAMVFVKRRREDGQAPGRISGKTGGVDIEDFIRPSTTQIAVDRSPK